MMNWQQIGQLFENGNEEMALRLIDDDAERQMEADFDAYCEEADQMAFDEWLQKPFNRIKLAQKWAKQEVKDTYSGVFDYFIEDQWNAHRNQYVA